MTSRYGAAGCYPSRHVLAATYRDAFMATMPESEGVGEGEADAGSGAERPGPAPAQPVVESNGGANPRLAELQRRVRRGEYDNRSVMEQVARRILKRGDL